MTDKERRDKRFRKLCKWMSEAGEIAEILRDARRFVMRTSKAVTFYLSSRKKSHRKQEKHASE